MNITWICTIGCSATRGLIHRNVKRWQKDECTISSVLITSKGRDYFIHPKPKVRRRVLHYKFGLAPMRNIQLEQNAVLVPPINTQPNAINLKDESGGQHKKKKKYEWNGREQVKSVPNLWTYPSYITYIYIHNIMNNTEHAWSKRATNRSYRSIMKLKGMSIHRQSAGCVYIELPQ